MCAAYLVVAARLGDRPELLPAEERLSALAEGEHGHPLMASVLRVLLGRQGRAEAIAQAASTPDPDEIHLWLALIALAAGDRAQALADLDRVDAHPTWVEAGASRRLRQWLHSDPALPGSRGKAVSDF